MSANAATVTTGNGKITFTDTIPNQGTIKIEFKQCMANMLFTFSDVYLDNKNINHTDSDNIGPFLLTGRGWCGGNHLYPDNNSASNMHTAKTESVSVTVDGEPADIDEKSSFEDCKVLRVEVENTIYIPGRQDLKFCTETMVYHVSGNSIEINGTHNYKQTLNIDRYYGMQSMMIGETEMLTPGGEYYMWTPINKVSEFTKASAPDFCTFIEHSANGYQAAWMDRNVDLGDRHLVKDTDVVFIGNSWTKSYHKIIGSSIIKNNDKTEWHGIYTWFKRPVLDNARDSQDGDYTYLGYVKGEPTEFCLTSDGAMTLKASVEDVALADNVRFAFPGNQSIIVTDAAPDATCYNIAGKPVFKGNGTFKCAPGVYIVSDGKGKSVKVLVK